MTIAEIEQQQKELCSQLKIEWAPIDWNMMIAINESIYSDLKPTNGLRHQKDKAIDGWYIWNGREINPDDENFFQPIHAAHLLEKHAFILKYLGLPYGYRFQVDKSGYEDVWFDPELLTV